MNKPVSVIILNWNGAKLLREFLPSVITHTPDGIADIVVADNGSTDSSINVIRDEFPTVRLMRFEENLGFAGGYNRAIAETDTKYIVLLNSDVAVDRDWLTPLYTFMERNDDVAACQPKIRAYTARDRFEYAGAAGGFLDRNGYPYCRGRLFDTIERDEGQYDTSIDVDWASGACLMVRRDVYQRVGGLDTAFFAHMEEIDLCWRMRIAGYRIAAVGDSHVFHLGGGSLPASNPRKTYLNFRNNLLMLRKNLPGNARRTALFRRRLLDTVAWFRMIVTFDFKNSAALLRAHRDYRRMSASATDSHAKINLLKDRPNLLTAYFLKGRKHYDDL